MSAILQISEDREYTCADWLKMERPVGVNDFELVDGKLYSMASPTVVHQGVLSELCRQFANYLIGRQCKIYPGVGVRLAKNTIYVPDLMLVCDKKKLKKYWHEGAPDLIIEILSPSNTSHDTITKFDAYFKAGLMEYWIVDTQECSVTRHRLRDGREANGRESNEYATNEYAVNGYVTSKYTSEDDIPVDALPGFEVDLGLVFREDISGGYDG